jgi:hypothetical protein
MIAQLNSNYLRRRPARALARLTSYALFEGRALLQPGRWINPLVFAHFSLEKRLPQMKAVRPPLFIMGTGRSGTTILGTVLSFHRDVGYLNEPKAMWYSVLPAEDIIGSYGDGDGRYLLTEEDASERVCRDAQRLYGAYLRLTRSQLVVDKSDWTFRVPFLRKVFPGSRFVWLVRNGWDTCASIGNWSQREETRAAGSQIDWWGRDGRKWNLLLDQVAAGQPGLSQHMEELRQLKRPRDRAVLEWLLNMRQGQAWQERYPAEVMQVRFEDFCATPRQVVGDLLRFCDLAPDAELLDYADETLNPARQYQPFALPEVLQGPFAEMMHQLGYDELDGKGNSRA